jgi:hypothetical protein
VCTKKLFLCYGNVHNIIAFINTDDNTFDAFLVYLPFYHSYNNKQVIHLLGFCTAGNIQAFAGTYGHHLQSLNV